MMEIYEKELTKLLFFLVQKNRKQFAWLSLSKEALMKTFWIEING